MKLTDYLKPDHIFPDFQAKDKCSALKSLCRLAAGLHGLDYQKILKVVLDREASGSTGLGGAVALPHGKSAEVERPILLMALSRTGVDFDSLDGKPVRLFVLLLSPKEGDGGEHLQLLASLGRLLKSSNTVAEILSSADAAGVYELLKQRD